MSLKIVCSEENYKKIMMTDHIVSEEELPDEELPRVKIFREVHRIPGFLMKKSATYW